MDAKEKRLGGEGRFFFISWLFIHIESLEPSGADGVISAWGRIKADDKTHIEQIRSGKKKRRHNLNSLTF